jgi:hypothetical protein
VVVVVVVVVEVVMEVEVEVVVLVVELCTNNLITSSMSNNSKHSTSPSITCGVKDEGGGRDKSKTNKQSLLMLPTSSSPWYDTAPTDCNPLVVELDIHREGDTPASSPSSFTMLS